MSFLQRFDGKSSKIPIKGIDSAIMSPSYPIDKVGWLQYLQSLKDEDLQLKEESLKFELMDLDKKQKLI